MTTTRWISTLLTLVGASACGLEAPEHLEGPVGFVTAALNGPTHDVAAVRFHVVEAGESCDAEPVATHTAVLEEEDLVPSLAGGDAHAFSSAFFVLPEGDYRVCATLLDDGGQPSAECEPADGSASVTAEQTSEVVLVSQCGGDAAGGLGIVAGLNDAPVIEDLTLSPSAFITICESAELSVLAADPNGDPLTVELALTASPEGADANVTRTGEASASFAADQVGDYEVTVTVRDDQQGEAALAVPLHVAPCIGGDILADTSVGIATIDSGSGAMITSCPDIFMETLEWSPDGSQIAGAFRTATSHDEIAVVSSDCTGFEQLTFNQDPYGDYHPHYRDTDTLWFGRQYATGTSEFFEIGVDGSGQTQLTDFRGTQDRQVSDLDFVGDTICYRKQSPSSAGTGGVWCADLPGFTNERHVGGNGGKLDISPDGTRVVYAHHDQPTIHVANTETPSSAVTIFTCPGGRVGDAVWSPDGREIAFACYVDGNYDIFVVAEDGTGARNLTATPDVSEKPNDWR